MARLVTLVLICGVSATTLVLSQAPRSIEAQFKAAQHSEEVEGDLQKAMEQYRQIAQTGDRAVAARALIRLAECYQKLGDSESRKIYERILRDYSDQKDAALVARTWLEQGIAAGRPALTTRRVLDGGGAWDRISPDGMHVARPEDKTGNLVLYDLKTGTLRPLTSDGTSQDPGHQFPLASVFSRDGRQIAYEWYVEDKDQSILRIIGTEGPAKMSRTLYDNPDADVSPLDWSPDRRWIAVLVERKDGTKQIGVVGAADGALRVLKTVDWSRVGGLRFSPDSSWLAYHRPPQEGVLERDVFLIAVDGSQETALAASPGDDIVLEWIPDSMRLLIASDRSGSNSVWSVPAVSERSTTLELVKSDIGIISSIGPTRDGTLFYNVVPAKPGIYTATFDVASGQLSPGSTQALQQFKGFAFFPQFLDDGKSLSYASRRDVLNPPANVFVTLSTDSGQVREVRPALGYGNFPHWFPDGHHVIVYGVDLKGRPGVFKVDTKSGSVALTLPRDTCNLPFLASNGLSIFCHSPAQKQLRQLDASSGAVIRTLNIEGQPYAASPDGRYVVTSSLHVVSLQTGESRPIIPLSPPTSQVGNNFTIDWTPDSRSVVFYGHIDGDEGMWRVPIDGGAAQKINVNVGTILSWRSNARTGRVAFSTNGVGPRLETWKMEHFLPVNGVRR